MTRFIAPRTGAPEVTLAEEQSEYAPITVALYVDSEFNSPVMLARITFTDAERLAIAKGEDVYIGQLTFGRSFTPLQVVVGQRYFKVEENG